MPCRVERGDEAASRHLICGPEQRRGRARRPLRVGDGRVGLQGVTQHIEAREGGHALRHVGGVQGVDYPQQRPQGPVGYSCLGLIKSGLWLSVWWLSLTLSAE